MAMSARSVGDLIALLSNIDPNTSLATNSDGMLHILHAEGAPTLIQLPEVPTKRYEFTWRDTFIGSFCATEACMAGFMAVQRYENGRPCMKLHEQKSGRQISYAYTANYHPITTSEPMRYIVTVRGLADKPIVFGSNALDFLRGLHLAALRLDLNLYLSSHGGGSEHKDFWSNLIFPHIRFERRPSMSKRSALDLPLPTGREEACNEGLYLSLQNDLTEMGFTPPDDLTDFMSLHRIAIEARYIIGDDNGFDMIYQAATRYFGATDLPAIYGSPLAAIPTLFIHT